MTAVLTADPYTKITEQPEALLEGLFRIQEKMKYERILDRTREGLRPELLVD